MVLHRPFESARITGHLATSTSDVRELRLIKQNDCHCLSVDRPLEQVKSQKTSQRPPRYPPLRLRSGQALAKNARTGDLEANFRPPFEHIREAQIPLTRLKNGVAVDSRSPERLSDNRTMSYGSLSQRKQGGMDEIHLFGIPRARQVRKHV